MEGMMILDIGPWKPFLLYFLLILTPWMIYHFYCLKRLPDLKHLAQDMKETILQYHVRHSGVLTMYHIFLTLGLTFYFVQIILTDLKIAVDLSYYTKTSISAYQVLSALPILSFMLGV